MLNIKLHLHHLLISISKRSYCSTIAAKKNNDFNGERKHNKKYDKKKIKKSTIKNKKTKIKNKIKKIIQENIKKIPQKEKSNK